MKTSSSIKIFLILTLLTPINAYAMLSSKSKLPTTPVALPIDISKKGNKAEIDVRIESKNEKEKLEPESTAFELEFIPYDPTKDSKSKYYISPFREHLIMIGALRKYFEPEYTREEREEIGRDHNRVLSLLDHEQLISSGTGASYKSKWIQNKGIPIPNIRIAIISLDDSNQKVVYDEVLEVKKHPEIGGYFYKYLDRVNLDPGKYKIIFEIQSDAVKFSGTKVLLIIGSYRAKV